MAMRDASQAPQTGAAADPWAELVGRAVAGDAPSMEALLLRLLPRARNLVRYLVRRDREVDDIVQVALLLIARRLSTFEGRGAFTSWADRLVARTTFAELRKRDHLVFSAAPPYLEAMSGPEDVATPLDYTVRRRVVRLLDQLSLEQRTALVLHHVLELTVPEIAYETGAPVETVRSRLRLGRERLRLLGAEDLAERDDPGERFGAVVGHG
jgi:RNA polymerase sigma-70 factor (ECF subfamily)